MEMTCGKATSDFTLGSQLCCSTAFTALSPLRPGLARDQRAAWTTSIGYVDAIRICDSSESGYNATGASIWSSSCCANTCWGCSGWP